MAKNDSLKSELLQPHFDECGVPHGLFSLHDDALNGWKNSVFANHRPSATSAESPSFLRGQNFLIGIHSLKTFAFDICLGAVSFCTELNCTLVGFLRKMRRSALTSILRERFALLKSFQPGNASIHS